MSKPTHAPGEVIYPSPWLWHPDLLLVNLTKQTKYTVILVYRMTITDSAISEPTTGHDHQPHEGRFLFYKLDTVISMERLWFLSLNSLRNQERAFHLSEQLTPRTTQSPWSLLHLAGPLLAQRKHARLQPAEHILASFWITGIEIGHSEVSHLQRCSSLSRTECKNTVSLLSLHTKPTPVFLSRLLSSFPHRLGRELEVTVTPPLPGQRHAQNKVQFATTAAIRVMHYLHILFYTSPYQSLAQRNSEKKISSKLKYQLLVSR